ncbi:MAG: hypothetical protein ACKVT2_14795 [Saprospiraceae bacterium]
MFHLPSFRRITQTQEVDQFAAAYLQCSGFNVPREYYESNQMLAIYWKGEMIGGFVLGAGSTLRTLEVFAGCEHRKTLYQKVENLGVPHTEMCCFWIKADCRKKTFLNFFVWLCVAFALRVYGSKQLIFGTNSARLAALYSAAPKSRLMHTDCLNQKRTFIFTGPRKDCLSGVVHILYYKAKRLLALQTSANKPEFKMENRLSPAA